MRTVPVNQSAMPFLDGCEPLSFDFHNPWIILLHDPPRQHFDRLRTRFSSHFQLWLPRGFNSGVAILHIQTVQSLDPPELALYCTLRRVEEHERAGVLVATNAKVVKRLLASRFIVVSALLTPAWLEKLEPLLRARPEGHLRLCR